MDNSEKENGAGQSAASNVHSCRQNNFKNSDIGSSRQLDFQTINATALPVLPAILARWLPDGTLRGPEYTARNPRRADRRAGSFSVNVRTGKWADFATGDKGGDVISLAAYLFNLPQGEALHRVAGMLGVRHD